MSTDATSVESAGLRTELLELFRAGAGLALSDQRFEELARRVFAHSFAAVPAYRAYCRARGRTPENVPDWTEIPAVPTAAFKELPLRDETATVERVFRTSGTTRGPERRGEHHVVDLALYQASLRATFQAYLLPDGARPRCLTLMVPADQAADSSLAFMISDVLATFGDDDALTAAGAMGIDYAALERGVAQAEDDGAPVLLLGTSAAFIHWMDRLADAGTTFALPTGSRLMDTGGYKGRGRDVAPPALRAAYRERLGIEGWACVNEYGMTELLSQYYDTGLREHVRGEEPTGRKRGPGWLRSVAVDPESLAPLPAGRQGLLRHVDLANLYSVPAVQTEDVGRVDQHGLVLEGRVSGAPARGCSIAMDLLLERAP